MYFAPLSARDIQKRYSFCTKGTYSNGLYGCPVTGSFNGKLTT
jgi:hypothetical protein